VKNEVFLKLNLSFGILVSGMDHPGTVKEPEINQTWQEQYKASVKVEYVTQFTKEGTWEDRAAFDNNYHAWQEISRKNKAEAEKRAELEEK
jgi:hypothetical protein